ncbi:MAG TPA: Mur ligase family protein [Trueperaceae bacterium]
MNDSNACPSTYPDALAWLYARSRGGLPRDPERMRSLVRQLRLSMPPRSVHVVGTNGKGTVTAMIAAAQAAAGHTTGRFVSPHVEDFRERIAVNGVPIGMQEVLAFVRRLAGLELSPAPAFFELTFALALDHFRSAGVEMAAVEAGVGARLDATITLGNVATVVITNVDRDHLDTLGPGLEDIARDKAEAIRPGVPTVSGVRGRPARVIAEVAAARRSPLFADSSTSRLFALPAEIAPWRAREPQRWQNARLAAAALRLAGSVPEAAIREGVRAARLPARAEVFWVRGRKVVLDGGHNPGAAHALRKLLPSSYVLVFAALPRKLGEETLAVLEGGAARTFITQVGDQASALASAAGRSFVIEPAEALEAALDAAPAGGVVVIAGSFYLAGQLRPRLLASSEPLEPAS